jgi:hypothetical protein
MRRSLIALACVAVLATTGCGGGSSSHERPATGTATNAAAGLPEGCRPAQVATLLTGFFTAAHAERRGAALRYIAQPPELVGFSIYDLSGAGEGRLNVHAPIAVYDGIAHLIRGHDSPALLAAAVGKIGPFAVGRTGPTANDPTAGVDFVFGLGSWSLSGKVGINCKSGRLYAGAMNVRHGLKKQQQCSKYLRLHASKPAVCAYKY